MANITDSLDVDESLGELLNNDRYREFLQTVSHFHSYSCRNILLIFKQMPHATKIATYDTWKNQYDRTIIKGSTGIRILSPVPTAPKKTLVEKIDPDTGTPILDGDGKKIFEASFSPGSPKFKEISVFDITQTRGSPILKLIDNISDNEALSGAFFDSMKIVFAPFAVSNCTAQKNTAKIFKNIIAEKISFNLKQNSTLPQVGEKLACDSVVYVVCKYFGIDTSEISFDYLLERAEEITPFFGDVLDMIKTEASKIITALEDNFKRLCEERGVNPMTKYESEIKTVEIKSSKIISHKEPPIEPPYNVAPRIKKTAIGVDFTHYDVLPVKPVLNNVLKADERIEPPPTPPKQTPATQIFIPRKQIPPDALITISDRERYGYSRCQELLPLKKERAENFFKRNMRIYLLFSDNRERMVSDLHERESRQMRYLRRRSCNGRRRIVAD